MTHHLQGTSLKKNRVKCLLIENPYLISRHKCKVNVKISNSQPKKDWELLRIKNGREAVILGHFHLKYAFIALCSFIVFKAVVEKKNIAHQPGYTLNIQNFFVISYFYSNLKKKYLHCQFTWGNISHNSFTP